MSGFNDPIVLESIIFFMFGSMILEFFAIIYMRLGGHPVGTYRILRIPFFFHGFEEADGEITIHTHKRKIIENNPPIEEGMIPHYTCKERGKPAMYLIDQANANRKLGRDFYINRPGQAVNLPMRTGYNSKLISAEALERAFKTNIIERLRRIAETREKKTRINWKGLIFGLVLVMFGIIVIYYGLKFFI